jgi:hypothetical protein
MTDMSKHASKSNRPWFLYVIAVPAAVEVWACWVGLGSLCGFPVLGLGRLHISTGWTLAIGMEAYGAYALNVWLHKAPGPRSRKFAQWSAGGAFTLSLLGQVAYHVMRAKHVTVPPPVVIVFVACLPVALLAFAVILTHLMHADERAAISAGEERTLQAALDAERAARLQAEADRNTARAEAADTAVREAALAQQAERRQADTAKPKPARHKAGNAARRSAAKGPEAQAAEVVTRVEAELILAAEPDISGSELGRRLGVQPGYGRRLRRELTQAAPGGGE